MDRFLIVNADDLNMTGGVSEGILETHLHGIVTSATMMINLPLKARWVQRFKKVKSLGIGLHLNVTSGEPVSRASGIKSLLGPDGRFKKYAVQMADLPLEKDLITEWTHQIGKFRKAFSRLPTHLDTHHQTHDHPLFFRALQKVARRFRLPVRRSALMPNSIGSRNHLKGSWNQCVSTTDYLFDELKPEDRWKLPSLLACLEKLPSGVSEVMCHPGFVDRDLRSVSSFTDQREIERQIFQARKVKEIIARKGIILTHFGLCYT